MKKTLLLGLCLLVISCSKNDDVSLTETPTNSLLGKWKLLKIDFYPNYVFGNTQIENQDNITCPDYIEFNANGELNTILKDENCVITFSSNMHYIYNPTLQILTITETEESFSVLNITNNDLTTEISYTESGIQKKRIAYYQKII